MLNNIIKGSLSNRAAILIAFGLILIAGASVLMRMEIDIFPDLNAPTVVVMTEAPGLSAEEVEKTVTRPIEAGLNGAGSMRRVRSSSTTGFSVVWAEFKWGTDIYKARQTVAEKLTELSDELPANVGSPIIGPQSSILGEMLIIGLTADSTDMMHLRTIADRVIGPRLLSIGGVSQVSVLGGEEKEYQIQVIPAALKNYNVTAEELLAAVESLNNNATGGVINQYGNEYIVKTDIMTSSVEQFGQAVIKSDQNGIVRLSDVAEIKAAGKYPNFGCASVNAGPAVLLTVTKQPGVGTIPLTEAIQEQLDELKSSLPSDVKINTDIFRQSDFINNSIGNLQMSLIEGSLFVIAILFFFLMNVRTTAISVVTLPVSVIVTIIILHILGLNINTMTLGGIAIAIGSLVDDAVVDVENVYKRLKENKGKAPVIDVVLEASKEVRYPIFNSSLIIIASFLPLFFLSGFEGRMLVPLGVSFIVALIASTFVALTLTPVLCSYLLKSTGMAKDEKEPKTALALKNAYVKGLNFVMAHTKGSIIVTCGLFVFAVILFFTLGRSFLPPFNEGSFTINISALPGISLSESDHIGRVAEKEILSVPEIKIMARKTGRAELDEHSLGTNVSEIEAPYTLDNGRSRKEVEKELRDKLSKIPGVNIEIGQPISHRIDAMLSGTEAQISIKVFGDDINRLYSLGKKISESIQGIPGVVDVNVEQQMQRPQIDLRPRRELMAAYGITNAQFAQCVNMALGGVKVSEVYEDGTSRDITVRIHPDYSNSLESLADVTIDSNQGPIPLSYIAEFVSTTGPNSVNRENNSRRLVVSTNVSGRDLKGAVDDIKSAIKREVEFPEGYYVTYGGQFENEESASRTLLLTSILALIIIFLLLMSEFKNVRESLIVLANMPFAMIGGVIILRLTSGELNIPAIIGFISLLGISTRNGMLLISRYNSLLANGESLTESIYEGAKDRVLPIVMTALTSALALIPLALRGGEPGNEIQSPMAIVILGGLLTSTFLNLFIVPVVFYITTLKSKHK